MAKKKETTVVGWQPKDPAYVIRTCKADGTAHSGFLWPESGFVEAPDWKPSAECGNGLHGLIDGLGDYSLLSNAHDARWQVVLVDRAECVQIDNSKVKFPHGIVEYSGNMATALTRISQEWMKLLIKATEATATTGYRANSATTGEKTVSACLGLTGKAKAGKDGAIAIAWWDEKKQRPRISVGYVGEELKADTWYSANEVGELVEAESNE